MLDLVEHLEGHCVALLAEGVDRNTVLDHFTLIDEVALLAEGVDRNVLAVLQSVLKVVALLAEGVDRNGAILADFIVFLRVALLAEGVDRNTSWRCTPTGLASVALLAEGVDRNFLAIAVPPFLELSPSSRRAWIEIRKQRPRISMWNCRPPRGGRG